MTEHEHSTRAALPADIRARLDLAYLNRTRRQCSHEDFESGYLAALADYGLAPGAGPHAPATAEREISR